MTVTELVHLLEQQDGTLQIAVGDYRGEHSPLGWNNTHEYSHGPVWVGEQEDPSTNLRFCFIGINCYDNKPKTYRTIKNGEILDVVQYYARGTFK